MSTIEVGELLYEYTVKLTHTTEYGVAFASLAAGAPPPEGARFDVAFEGPSIGPRLKGTVTGVDYFRVRADGRSELHIHATITTDDGHNIALFADGVAVAREGSPLSDLRENATLHSGSEAYRWVNRLQVWAVGTLDLAKQEVHLKGYAA